MRASRSPEGRFRRIDPVGSSGPVVNSAGFVVASEELAVESFTVAGVELTSVEPSAATGHIQLTWDRYGGPGFDGYGLRVMSRTRQAVGIASATQVGAGDSPNYQWPQDQQKTDGGQHQSLDRRRQARSTARGVAGPVNEPSEVTTVLPPLSNFFAV